jgi:RNA polymerase sigma-70 factor (ECF subfamily)
MNRAANGSGRDSSSSESALFDELYEAHSRMLYAYLLGCVGDSELAADLLQENLLRAWRSISDLRQVPSERRAFWLFRVARNLVTDHQRRRKTSERYLAGAVQAAAAQRTDPSADPVHVLETRESVRAIDKAVARLPEELRVVLALHLMTEMTSAQIGEILGRPAGTVRYQLARARRRLAQELDLPGSPGSLPSRTKNESR